MTTLDPHHTLPAACTFLAALLLGALLTACEDVDAPSQQDAAATPYPPGSTAWTGARLWHGGDGEIIDNAALVVYQGRVIDVFSLDERTLPDTLPREDTSGRFIVPGLINAHGHVGVARGLDTGAVAHSRDNVEAQLRLYAHYGITTVVSLGDEPAEAFAVRDTMPPENPRMARLFLAGDVLHPPSPGAAAEAVATLSRRDRPDWIKIRVDDFLGTADKMPPDTYAAVIQAAHALNHPLASHMVTLDDAKGLLRAGTNLIAHSVRDAEVDDELIALMRERDICMTPTLTREVSVFVYAGRPDFFDDPFFLEKADPAVLEALQQPDVQRRFRGHAADYYRAALPLAKRNMVHLHEAGVRIAMGTDSGPPARFQGYFEHMEMVMMQEAGMSAREVLISATRDAADCTGIGDTLGTLKPGMWADFLILREDPLRDVRALREIDAVVIAGEALPRAGAD